MDVLNICMNFLYCIIGLRLRCIAKCVHNTSENTHTICIYIFTELYSMIKESLIQQLLHICNMSLSNGVFPDVLKITRVVPIHENGQTGDFNNHRLISVLPFFSKRFEKLVYNRMLKFIDDFNVIHDNQFGFRRNRSTYMVLNVLLDKFHESVISREYMIGLFMELSRAFDTISHDILLNKLYKYGIRWLPYYWIKSYLSNRKQYVNYKNNSSDTLNVNIGIPQGSILGPLVFILYINNLHNVSDKLTLLQFADDSSFFVSGRSLPELFNVLQNKIAAEWWFSTVNWWTNHFSSQWNNFFVWVIIDDRMTFKSHINHIAGKMSKGVGIICKARKLLPQYSLKTIYRAIVEPYMTYCIEVWGHTYGTYTNKLFMLQKKNESGWSLILNMMHIRPLYLKACNY